MSYETAQKVKRSKGEYKNALWQARKAAIELATKLMRAAVDGDGPVSRESVAAMSEVLKEAREMFSEEEKRPKKNKPGSPVDAAKALADLEGM